MVDIHCHFIPKIDDGSKSATITLSMIKKAKELGYNAIFATPHFIEDSHETKKRNISISLDVLNKMLDNRDIDVKLYGGNEIYYSSNILDLIENNKVCTLADSRYFLMELPFVGKVLGLEKLISKIVDMGYVPIIAHPERYEFVNKDYKQLYNIIMAGALLQVNVSSILGEYGLKAKMTVKKLLKNDMASFIATDSHNETDIYERFNEAKKKILKIISEEKWNELTNLNQQNIIENKRIY